MKVRSGLAAGITRECELLLLCCSPVPSEITAGVLQTLVREGVDWDQVFILASRHAAMPLLCSRLMRTCQEIISRDVLENLKNQWRQIVAQNLFLTSDLTQILSLFEANGVTAVPFKGPALSTFAYGDISLRQFGDLDVFLHWDDLPLAKNLLLSQGYHPEIALSGLGEAAYLRSQYHYVWIDAAEKVMVELHWEFTPKYLHFPLVSTGLWDRLERRHLAGQEVFNFSPEDLLLILCIHGAEHFWERLGWISDVAHLIRREAIAWGKVFEMAAELGCQRMLSLGLFLASDLLGSPLPAEVRERLQADRMLAWLARLVHENLFGKVYGLMAFFKNNLFQLGARELLREKIRYCFYLPFTPTISDWQCLSFPPRLAFLYGLLRPLRLTLKHCFRLKVIP